MRHKSRNPMQRHNRFASLLASLTLLLIAAAPSMALAVETITYYHLDALGSPVVASDELGNLKWREDYKPYGEKVRNEPASASNSRAYTGHPHDNETGLTYAGARYYDPVVGRFMAMDPIGFSAANLHSFNRYNYGNNNPYSFIDPDGKLALFQHFFITYDVSRDMGMGVFASTRLAWNTMMVDFRPESQAMDNVSTSQHFMSGVTSEGNFQTPGESMSSGMQKMLSNLASGDLPGALHAAQDAPAGGHGGTEWTGFKYLPPSISCLLGCSQREYESLSREHNTTVRHLMEDSFPSAGVKEQAYTNSIGVFGMHQQE